MDQTTEQQEDGQPTQTSQSLTSQILYFKPILAAIFVTIATVKLKQMSDFYTLVIFLINQSERRGEN